MKSLLALCAKAIELAGKSRPNNVHPLFYSWHSMLARCSDPRSTVWHNYGGRGIKVCDRWRASFWNFYADVGDRPFGMSLDRINNDGNYEPGNVRWASKRVQQNNRRNSKMLTINGRTECLTDWAREYGLSRFTLAKRLRIWGMVPRIITEPILDYRAERSKKQRAQQFCKRGHPLFGQNMFVFGGHRICKACRRISRLKSESEVNHAV